MARRLGVGVYGYDGTFETLKALNTKLILLMKPPLEYYVRIRLDPDMQDAFIALRMWRDINNQPLTAAGAAEFADECVQYAYKLTAAARQAGVPEQFCRPSAITTYNETPHDQPIEYDTWCVAFASIVKYRHGFPVIWGNQGVGSFQIADVYPGPYNPLLDDYVASTSAGICNYYGPHLYSAEGEPVDGPQHEWFATRFDKTVKAWKLAHPRAPMPPIISTESGTNKPWHGKITDVEFFRQITWLQAELDRVDGRQCIFGIFNTYDTNWQGFNLHGGGQAGRIVELIGSYNKAGNRQ